LSSVVRVLAQQIIISEEVDLFGLLKMLKLNERQFVAARVNNVMVDLSYKLDPNNKLYEVEFIPCDDKNKEALEVLRHSAAHITAQAVLRLYKGAKLGFGPPIENGFYYDIEFPTNIAEEDLPKIEEEIKKIVKEKLVIKRIETSRNEAIEMMGRANQDYKVEYLTNDIKSDIVSFYIQGEFIDLCEGPHVPNTSYLENIKLERITGAYWKGNEKNKMLQRIYGTAFFSKEALENYFRLLEEQKKRDHRVLNKSLELFSIEEEAGAGLIFWHPNGAMIRYIIEKVWKKAHLKYGYKFVYTPHIANSRLWEISGHLQYYKDNMYPLMEFENFKVQLKPMNCPGHILIFKSRTRSYRELPLRFCELGTVYRYERGGVIGGLFRVRGFTQDDAHIFCEPSQIEGEVMKIIEFTKRFLAIFGFSTYRIIISTRPPSFIGDEQMWEQATVSLKNALEKLGISYSIAEGEGAFYGPKIDVLITDALGREWQCSTVQVDFNLPQRFQLRYAGQDNMEHTPVMIHRAILGSFERFFGVLIEHLEGVFPLWLAPVQVALLPVSEKQIDYSKVVYEKLVSYGIRCETLFEKKNISSRVRECILRKIPYIVVVGDTEEKQSLLSIRSLKKGHLGTFTFENFLQMIKDELQVPEV
jgi:threonyl-tRNA synthetase